MRGKDSSLISVGLISCSRAVVLLHPFERGWRYCDGKAGAPPCKASSGQGVRARSVRSVGSVVTLRMIVMRSAVLTMGVSRMERGDESAGGVRGAQLVLVLH